MNRAVVLTLGCLWLTRLAAVAAPEPTPIAWQAWSQQAFDQARKEHKLVILDVEAVWCHWCHVMDTTTYRDPKVTALLKQNFVALRVDQDARPDISTRYEDYGWPATVIFNGKGDELVKFAGYIPPRRMLTLLQATVKDPTPGPSVLREAHPHFPAEGSLSPALKAEIASRYLAGYDSKLGGWGDAQKFMDWDSVEYAMLQARSGEASDAVTPDQGRDMALQTLKAQLQLLDPVWGGVYQYSDGGVWTNPHYEKIMLMQANDLRVFSLASKQFHDPSFLDAGRRIVSYLKSFLLAPNGGFYTSQDADHVDGVHSTAYFSLSDADRRARGIPRVDKHQYARENGWAIQGLVAFSEAAGDADALQQALTTAHWVVQNRSLGNGGFKHDATDVAGPYLGDSLAMAEASIALYQATADRTWLEQGLRTAHFIQSTFASSTPGYRFAVAHEPQDRVSPEVDENLHVARLGNILYQLTGDTAWKAMRTRAMRFAAAPEVARDANKASLLLTDSYLATEPLHITVMGPRDSDQARALYQEALADSGQYRRIEWLDATHPPLRKDVEYPTFDKPAAFVCSGSSCSTPAFDVDKLRRLLTKT